MDVGEVRCSSPTCTATFSIRPHPGDAVLRAEAEAEGWRWEQQPGDDRRLPYCGRDRL